MLVTMKEILDKAQEGNYAVPAPNVLYELETRAVLELAEELNSPLILDVFPFVGPEIIRLAKVASIPVAVNLDHGRDFSSIIRTITKGVSSVMIDRSTLPYEENIQEVKEMVKIAHAAGITVEAELGHVGQGSNYDVDGKKALTDVNEAVKFVEETGVDALAVAIGTAHGLYSGTPHIDFERLTEIDNAVSVPLVLHGGSGTGFDNISKACKMGINKVNVNTDLQYGALERLKKHVEENNPMGFQISLADGYRDILQKYMEACGCIGKAWVRNENSSVKKEMGLPRFGKSGK